MYSTVLSAENYETKNLHIQYGSKTGDVTCSVNNEYGQYK